MKREMTIIRSLAVAAITGMITEVSNWLVENRQNILDVVEKSIIR